MADDLGFSDLGCYGSEIDTPVLNGLADKGVRFTQFQNTARCCPTRAALLTGLYSHQAGIGHMVEDYGYPAYRGELNNQCVTIAEALKPAGYGTAIFGKYHVARNNPRQIANWPLQRGFDTFYGTVAGAVNFFNPRTLVRGNTPIEPDKPDYYFTDAICDEAAQYIGARGRGNQQPFFLYLAHTAPHWPMQAREREIEKYKDRYHGGWDKLREERHARMVRMGLVKKEWGITPRDPAIPAWESAANKEWQARRMAVYAAMIDRLDQGIGRVLAALDRTGERDNTLVLFLADNGGCAEGMGNQPNSPYDGTTLDGKVVRRGNNPAVMPGPGDVFQSYGPEWAHASNTPFRLYKHWEHEGGISTPLIAHWPAGINRPNRLDHQHGHLIDIMATAVDVAGADYPKTRNSQAVTPLEGKSLRPILEGKQREGHRAVFWEHEGNRAVRMGRHKLVAEYRKPWELYDMDKDRTEMNNLAAAQPDRVAAMDREWQQWADRAGVMDYDTARKRRPA
jgi:arylsulfatase